MSLYLGSDVPLPAPTVPVGGLMWEAARAWVPHPLRGYRHVVALGQRGVDGLGCACMFHETVEEFHAEGPSIAWDGTLDAAPVDPFAALREMCRTLIVASPGKAVGLACDDFGGQDIGFDADSYDTRYLTLADIRKGALIFSDVGHAFPVRAYRVIDPRGAA